MKIFNTALAGLMAVTGLTLLTPTEADARDRHRWRDRDRDSRHYSYRRYRHGYRTVRYYRPVRRVVYTRPYYYDPVYYSPGYYSSYYGPRYRGPSIAISFGGGRHLSSYRHGYWGGHRHYHRW